jgi:transposase InsO family protein
MSYRVAWLAERWPITSLEALGMALGIPSLSAGSSSTRIVGVQYASDLYRDALSARGIVCSMSRVADCWDNAVAESFLASLQTELIHRRPWPTKAEAKAAVHDDIGAVILPHRRHLSLGYVRPMEFERQHAAANVEHSGLLRKRVNSIGR